MFTLYASLKFLHVLTASVWIGGFVTTEGLDDPEVLRLRDRLQRVHGIEALLLLSAVGAMVFKPVM